MTAPRVTQLVSGWAGIRIQAIPVAKPLFYSHQVQSRKSVSTILSVMINWSRLLKMLMARVLWTWLDSSGKNPTTGQRCRVSLRDPTRENKHQACAELAEQNRASRTQPIGVESHQLAFSSLWLQETQLLGMGGDLLCVDGRQQVAAQDEAGWQSVHQNREYVFFP